MRGSTILKVHLMVIVAYLCSNPSESPGMRGKALTKKQGYLQLFCTPRNGPAKYCAAFARRRSGFESPRLHSENIAICRLNAEEAEGLK